jgi:hypothetical protein
MSSVSIEGFGRCSLSFIDELGTGDRQNHRNAREASVNTSQLNRN